MTNRIGKTLYSEPRTVKVSDPNGDVGEDGKIAAHLAVYGTINVLVDKMTASNRLMGRWSEVISAANSAIESILAEE